MLRLAQDAFTIIKSIDPNALVTTPAPSTGINGVANWMGPYLALGGGKYADIITFHGYSWKPAVGVWPIPEDIVPLIDNLKAVLVANHQDTKPLWCTEGDWGDTSGNGFIDQDLHAAYLARHYLLQASKGVVRYYWFAWDNGFTLGLPDGLWTPTTGVDQAGIAYQQVENWLVGVRRHLDLQLHALRWIPSHCYVGHIPKLLKRRVQHPAAARRIAISSLQRPRRKYFPHH